MSLENRYQGIPQNVLSDKQAMILVSLDFITPKTKKFSFLKVCAFLFVLYFFLLVLFFSTAEKSKQPNEFLSYKKSKLEVILDFHKEELFNIS